MEKKNSLIREIKISEMPDDMDIKDLNEDDVIILDEYDPLATDEFWNEED